MQIILNIILRDHGTPVPGSSPVLLPTDIGRSVACKTNGSAYNHPEIISANGTFDITNCHDDLFNFYTEYNITKFISEIHPEDRSKKFNRTVDMLEELNITSLARPQDLLFNLPMFYIGK